MEVIYLDNNATTRPAPEVVAAMLPYFEEFYGNPSSLHRLGQRARQGVDEARGRVAGLIGCGDGEVVFTGGGTESINTAIRGLLAGRPGRRRIVISTVEHSATRELCGQLAKEEWEIVEIGVDRGGGLDLDALTAAVTPETALVSMLWANNETGVIFPVERISELCRGQRVPFHCDGTQAIGKIPVNAREAGMEAMSIASHKFHGPKGVGGLYVKRGVRVGPLVIGGPQERGKRGGTENVAGIVGMGAAAELAGGSLGRMREVAGMRDRLEREILGRIPETAVNGRVEERVPNTTNIGFCRLEAEAILLLLSERGICASAGAACSSGSLEPSHVLKGMKIDGRYAHGSVRFSFSRYSTDGEIDRVMEVLPGVIDKLRATLPVG